MNDNTFIAEDETKEKNSFIIEEDEEEITDGPIVNKETNSKKDAPLFDLFSLNRNFLRTNI